MASSNAQVLVIEDEPDLRDAMCTYLNMEGGLDAEGAGSLGDADRRMAEHDFDILILDLGLPDGDGLDWLGRRGDLSGKGVIITTARGTAIERVSGVRAGADVYLVKPVLLAELSALTLNLARRLHGAAPLSWTLNLLTWSLNSPAGASVKLIRSEHALLLRLARSPGESVARDDLVHSLGHDPCYYDARRMEILVRRLRVKAHEELGQPLPLETVRGYGYVFSAPIVVCNGR